MLVYTKTSMGRYQCPKCYREFSRSDSLRRHTSSGVCKEDSTNMTDSEESMDSSSSHDQPPFVKGEDVFGKYDEDDLEWTEEESDDDDDGDADEDSLQKKRKSLKIKIWDRLVQNVMDNMQDTFRDTVDETLGDNTDMDIKEAEEEAYEELKPQYISKVIDNYKLLVGLSSALKKDSMHHKITSTAKRLREKEDFDEDESMKYAVKKRKFLFEKKLDEYDPPRYCVEEDDETMPAPLSYNKLS